MFVPILNTSISASWLILAIIVIRLVFKKMPKALTCVLWGLVAIRLICPFSIESPLSLIPSAEVIPEEVLYMEGVQQHDPVEFNGIEVPGIQEAVGEVAGTTVSQVQIFDVYSTLIWLAGMTVMLLYALISYLRLRHRVIVSINEQDNIWLCDQIDSPFILGMFRPRIYMPSGMAEEQASYVIAHEQAHLQRHDHWWKPFGFFLLSVYWFNPLIWVAYILLSRDIELACDEKVIRSMETADKQAYSEALLVCSVNRRMIAACPLAFGEVGVKARVKSVLNYKKPALWIVATSVVICAVVAVCFLTNPEETDTIERNGESEVNESKTGEVPPEIGENRRNIGKTIFKSFAMEPNGLLCFLPEEYESYLTVEEYWEISQNIDRSVGCIMPVFFINDSYTELYAVNRDSRNVNHLYYFEKSTENKWVLNYSSETLNVEDGEVTSQTDGFEDYFDKKVNPEMEYQTIYLERVKSEIEAINEMYGSKITLHNIPENMSKEEFLAQLEEMAISSAKVFAGLQAHKDALQNASSEQDAGPSSEYTNTNQGEVQQSNVPENYIGGDKNLILARGGKLLPNDGPGAFVRIEGVYYKLYEDKNGILRKEYDLGNRDQLKSRLLEKADQLENGEFPVNSNGESYGDRGLSQFVGYDPELGAAVGTNGEKGYVRESEVAALVIPPADKCPHEFLVNLYESDGITVIGEFPVSCGGHFSGNGMEVEEVKAALADPSLLIEQTSSPADVEFTGLVLDVTQDEMTYEERLAWAQATPTYVGGYATMGRYRAGEGCIACLCTQLDGPLQGTEVIEFRFADSTVANLPLPPEGFWGGTIFMKFEDGTFILEKKFTTEKWSDDGQTLIHLKGTYHYELDLAAKTLSLTVIQ